MRLSILYRFFILSFVLFNTQLNASESKFPNAAKIIETGEISGQVIDFASREPLAGVNVLVLNTTLGASTDENGFYTINRVPAGEIHLAVSYIGYKSEKRTLKVEKEKATRADFSLMVGILETSAIVVTGTSTPYLYEEAPVKTEVVPRKLIEQTQSCNLAEALSLQTGVRVENNCQNCNFTQVRILGFDGKYSQILIDGDPVVSSLAGVYALEQFPDEMIGQIEIVKGGGSALYGAGAMAGTVNLRTRRPNVNKSRISYDIQSLDGRLDQRAGVFTELISDDGRVGAFMFGSTRKRDHYDHNDDGFSELGLLKHETLGLNSYFRPFGHGELRISFQRINEERRGGNDFDRPEHEADIAESTSHERWGGKVRWTQSLNEKWNYQTHYAFSILDRDSYYGGLGGNTAADSLAALRFYGNAINQTHIFGLKTNYSITNHTITFGGEYSSDYLQDQSVKDALYHIDNMYINKGVFIQDDFTLFNEKLKIVAGARLDDHSALSDPVVSPRLNTKVTLSGQVHLRAAFTTGFKAPQTFDEDLHIESLGGEQRVVRNDPNLEPERSQTISAGLEYEGFVEGFAVLAGITGFYSTLEDAFSEVENFAASREVVLWKRINSDGANVRGVEADLGFKPTSNSELRLGLTYKQGNYDSEQEIFDGVFSNEFLRTPDLYGYFRASVDVNKSLNLFGSARYTGAMFVPNEAREEIVKTSQTFVELDLGAKWNTSFMKGFGANISFGVKNITDEYQDDLQRGVDRDPAYLYGPQLPRRAYFGLEFTF